jgi:hypothetical protein
MVAAGEVEGEGGWLLKPSGSQAKEVSTADAQAHLPPFLHERPAVTCLRKSF